MGDAARAPSTTSWSPSPALCGAGEERDVDTATLTLWLLVATALAFDFLNGLHDAANSIATIVSTRVLKPRYAVAWAAFFNFVAFLFFGLHVAKTIGAGIVDVALVTDRLVFGALTGAIAWNIITWLAGIPSSSSHALVGGLVGAGLAKAGPHAIVLGGVGKTAAGIVASPAMGFILALVLIFAVSWIFMRARPAAVDRVFRQMQFISASAYSLGHGGNDAQKTMGIIAVLLFAHGGRHGSFEVPIWVVLSCQAAMALGTLTGGWRIVHTLWVPRSPGSRPCRASALRPAARSPSLRPPTWACRSPPPTPSPARSSASARPGAPRPCAGASRGGSSSPGSSPCR